LAAKTWCAFFAPELIVEWFGAVPSEKKRRQRRLVPVALFFGMILYASAGLRNLCNALGDALAYLEPGPPKDLSKGSVSPARERMPVEVLRQGWRHLLQQVAQIPARPLVAGLVVRCIDGTGLSVADTEENEQAYGRPGSSRGQTAFPKMRSVLVMDAATHIFIDEAHGPFDRCSEGKLTDELLPRVVEPGVLLEADRGFHSFERVARVLCLGGEVLLRVKQNLKLPILAELEDGSFLSVICSQKFSKARKRRARMERALEELSAAELVELSQDQRLDWLGTDLEHLPEALLVRVIEYDVVHPDAKRTKTRLLSSILDPEALPAEQASGGYHLRWGEEVGIREIKWLCDECRIPHLPGLSPASVEQDHASVLLAHSVLRATMLLAAQEHGQDPTRLSLSGARAVLQRYLPRLPHVPARRRGQWLSQLLREVARKRLPKPQERVCPRAVKVKMSKWPTRSRSKSPPSAEVQRLFEFRSAPVSVP
jgi:hypothetical protein